MKGNYAILERAMGRSQRGLKWLSAFDARSSHNWDRRMTEFNLLERAVDSKRAQLTVVTFLYTPRRGKEARPAGRNLLPHISSLLL